MTLYSAMLRQYTLLFLRMVLGTRIWAAEKPNLELFRPAWQREGLCQSYPDVNFFPVPRESSEPAKALCARCPVRDECLEFALEIGPSCEGASGAALRDGNAGTSAWSCPSPDA